MVGGRGEGGGGSISSIQLMLRFGGALLGRHLCPK